MIASFKDGEVTVDRQCHIEKMLQDFPIRFESSGQMISPAGANVFNEDLSKKSNKEQWELFHAFVAKSLLSERFKTFKLSTKLTLSDFFYNLLAFRLIKL